jgi:hypothetical protein
MDFWERYKIQTLVLDNSPQPLDEASQYKFCQYIYSTGNFKARSLQASTLIQTKYSIVISDDELYLPSTLKNMRDFLEENSDFESVGACTLAIWKYGPQISGNWAYIKTKGYLNTGDSALERIRYHTGKGKNPITSFFTSNLTRTGNLVRCLKLYSIAPVLATDALSVFSICAAGRSKYLDELYWIRNWNEFPKSHTGWDRSISLHEWWLDIKNEDEKTEFRKKLINFFRRIASGDDFEEAWSMILSANGISQTTVNKNKSSKNKINFRTNYPTINYWIKKLLFRRLLPPDVNGILDEMKRFSIKYSPAEVEDAIKIVSTLYPYKNW